MRAASLDPSLAQLLLSAAALMGATMGSGEAAAQDRGSPYVGIFGGAARSGGQRLEQTGTAYRRGDWRLDGFRDFNLPVAVAGRVRNRFDAAAGAHVGYEFALRRSRLRPAIELEYGYYATRPGANLANPATEDATAIGQGASNAGLADPGAFATAHYAAGEHRFADRMRLGLHTVMANGVVAFDTGTALRPYVGAGAGFALGSARRAVSLQTNPAGPVELTNDTHEAVNHFNSRDHDTGIAFAAQAKVGVRLVLTRRLSGFAEYRLIHIGAMRFDFGSTQYPGHPPTSGWTVRQGPSTLHAGIIGLRLGL
jgi:opacity protein-like surface antigen